MKSQKKESQNQSNKQTLISPDIPYNVEKYLCPGLYEIVCIPENKVYIGESAGFGGPIERIGRHLSSLNSGNHDCQSLQDDWVRHGRSAFQFQIIHLGVLWEDKGVRRTEEIRLQKLRETQGFFLYNKMYDPDVTALNVLRPSIINGISYPSITAASSALSISESEIRRRLKNPSYPEWVSLKPILHGYASVEIEGTVYNSIEAVVKAGLAKHRHQAYSRLDSPLQKWKGWVRLTPKKTQKKKEN